MAIVLFGLLLISKEDNTMISDIDETFDYRFYETKEKEEEFYHPVTGYKGTRSQIDAYICNRENDLKNNKG